MTWENITTVPVRNKGMVTQRRAPKPGSQKEETTECEDLQDIDKGR